MALHNGDQHLLLRRTVRLTARTAGLLFAAALATGAAGAPARRASQRLYGAFAAAHLAHFAAVSRYAMVTGGRNLFPGGRDLSDVGGWPTVLMIFGVFGGLVSTGQLSVAPVRPAHHGLIVAGHAANGLIGAVFVGTYLGQLTRSRWFAVPAAVIAAAATARLVAAARGDRL
jgi:hypothetical protein